MEWATIHKNELLDNWNYLKENKEYKKIEPLVWETVIDSSCGIS